MKKQIFSFTFFVLIFLYCEILGNEILKEYLSIKENLKEESISITYNYFFAVSYSKRSEIEKNDIEKNKLITNSKLINYLSTLVDWPKKIPIYLKNSLWRYHNTKKKYVFENSQIVDQGIIGKNYFVVVGIPKSDLLRYKVTYKQIINKIQN